MPYLAPTYWTTTYWPQGVTAGGGGEEEPGGGGSGGVSVISYFPHGYWPVGDWPVGYWPSVVVGGGLSVTYFVGTAGIHGIDPTLSTARRRGLDPNLSIVRPR